jgi:hypothetical protein
MDSSVPGYLIWQLPSQLAGNLLTENLSLRDISRLDVACCARKERSMYFEAMRAGGQLSEVNAGNDAIDWITKRTTKVGKLKVQSPTAIACLAKAVAFRQYFATIELRAAAWKHEVSELQTALVLLSAFEQQVSFLSARRFSNGESLPGGMALSSLQDFVADCFNDTSEWIANVISQNTSLRWVKLIVREPLPATVFNALLARRSTLVGLTIVVKNLTDALIDRVAANCPGLQMLEIENMDTRRTKTISQGVVSLAHSCTNLRSLKMVRVSVIDTAASQATLLGLKNLCVLECTHMLLNDAVLRTLAECRSEAPFLSELEITWDVQRVDTVAQAAVVLNSLRRLVLHAAYPPPPVDPLLAGLAQLFKLEDLTLKMPGLWLSQLISAVAQGSPNLRSVSVSCGMFNGVKFDDIALHCPLLEEIHSTGGVISDHLLHALVQHCPRFRALSEESRASRCEVTSAGLLAFIQGCPLLTTLQLELGSALNNITLQSLSQHSYYLQKLRLPTRSQVTEGAVVQLVASCKHLNTLWSAMGGGFAEQLMQMSRARGRKLRILPASYGINST